MPPRHVPKYPARSHKTGQARVVIEGKTHYLGRFGSPESYVRYEQVIAAWLGGRDIPPPSVARRPELPKTVAGLTVAELTSAYLRWAQGYYRKNDRPTRQLDRIAIATGHLLRLHGTTSAAGFGPRSLKGVREAMMKAGHVRTHINSMIGCVKRLFAWGVEEELIPGAVMHALRAVRGLRAGTPGVVESPPVGPVPLDVLRATQKHLAAIPRAMTEVQYLTGMRPGEVCGMRVRDLDRSGRLAAGVWLYTVPASINKTAHRGRLRVVLIGPAAQAVLTPFLEGRAPDACVFLPSEAVRRHHETRRHLRKTKRTPSEQVRQRKPQPLWKPGECYGRANYAQAIARACRRAGVEPWSPNRLRHLRASELRELSGLDVVADVLGHASPDTSRIYAEQSLLRAAEIMRRVG